LGTGSTAGRREIADPCARPVVLEDGQALFSSHNTTIRREI
jgi:hypothetical protein